MNKNIFNSVQLKKPNRNVFDLTHDVKQSMDFGDLIPVLQLECVPGDKFVLGCDAMVRLAPMLAPIMHRVDISVHYFFVPNRIIWPNWEAFITGQNGSTGLPPVTPRAAYQSDLPDYVYKMWDYMGIPKAQIFKTNPIRINLLAFAAYQKCYEDYYRDQNLIQEQDISLPDGDLPVDQYPKYFSLKRRAWEHDYFTASLPWAQKGASVDIPLGDVFLKENWEDELPDTSTPFMALPSGAPADNDFPVQTVYDGFVDAGLEVDGRRVAYDPQNTLGVGSTTINDLRRAFKLQEWLERNARGGTRYTEAIHAHFGVKSPDARLQRAEYITGIKSPIVISEVLNTTGTAEAPQGDMAGHGVGVTSGKSGSYYCQEHGYIIGIASVMPKTAYQDGIPKHYLKNDYLDYFFPSFAHLGEQEVLNAEIYADTATGDEAIGTFGYVPRYAEYKYMPSRVAGDFRTTLDYWHLGRKFSGAPALNQEFIECKPEDTNRIFAVTEGDKIWMHLLHRITAIRPMPKFGTPTI